MSREEIALRILEALIVHGSVMTVDDAAMMARKQADALLEELQTTRDPRRGPIRPGLVPAPEHMTESQLMALHNAIVCVQAMKGSVNGYEETLKVLRGLVAANGL